MTQIKCFAGLLCEIEEKANEWLRINSDKAEITIKQVIQNDGNEWTTITIVYEVAK